MAKDKTSFLLYRDIGSTIELLSDQKAGKLFKIILKYVNDENPKIDDPMIKLAFEPIKQSLKRDLRKYENIIDRNKTNGLKGGRPKLEKPKKPNGLIGNPKKPKKADSDSDSDSDIDIYRKFAHLSISKKEYLELEKKWTETQINDTLDSIENFANNKKYKSLYLTAINWLKKDHKVKVERDKQGRPIKRNKEGLRLLTDLAGYAIFDKNDKLQYYDDKK